MVIDEELVIRDKTGKPRIVMHARERHSGISILNDNGSQIMLEASGDRVMLRLRRGDGRECALLSAADEGTGFSLFDEQSRGRVHIFVEAGLSATLTVRNENAQVVRQERLF